MVVMPAKNGSRMEVECKFWTGGFSGVFLPNDARTPLYMRFSACFAQFSFLTFRLLPLIDMQYDCVRNVMTTDIISVQETDLVDLVASIMEWRNIRHIPVESARGELKGIITRKHIEQYNADPNRKKMAVAADIMQTKITSVEPETDVKYAMLLMIDEKISSLPVVSNGQLVGLLTDSDTVDLWDKLKNRKG